MKLSKNGETILNRYLSRDNEGKLIETPEQLLKRVAKDIAKEDFRYGSTKKEIAKTEKEFFEIMKELKFLPNLPALAKAGKKLQQLAADGKGNVRALVAARVEWQKDAMTGQMKMVEVPGSEFELPADLVLLAMGFVSPPASVLEAFGVEKDARGNARAATDGAGCYRTRVDKVFAAGDMRRGQSLVVWAIREGRQCARAVDEYLMGASTLPR